MLRGQPLESFDRAKSLFLVLFVIEDGIRLSFGVRANVLSPRNEQLSSMQTALSTSTSIELPRIFIRLPYPRTFMLHYYE